VPSRCGLYFFAAGFLAAVSLVAAAAAALTLTRYSALYNRAQEAKPLLAEASRLLRSIDVRGSSTSSRTLTVASRRSARR